MITLACRDVVRMHRFVTDLGWPEAPSSDEHHRVFQLENGVVLALYDSANYEVALGPLTDGFRGFTLAINVASRPELEAIHTALEQISGVTDLEAIVDSAHGFSGFSFRDPEGNAWDVAWAHGSRVDERGHLLWP